MIVMDVILVYDSKISQIGKKLVVLPTSMKMVLRSVE